MTMKLNQLLAIEKSVKPLTYAAISEAHKLNKKHDLFVGSRRVYESVNDDGEKFPDEIKLVQRNAPDVIADFMRNLMKLGDWVAAVDYANQQAYADLVVNGEVIAKNVPSVYFLFLEKQLVDCRTFISELPVLDASESWTRNETTTLWQSEPKETVKTKKVQKALVLISPTVEHPGQAVQITDDATIGHWNTTNVSGAIAQADQKKLLARCDDLLNAVKMSREQANMVEAPAQTVGTQVFQFLFGEK